MTELESGHSEPGGIDALTAANPDAHCVPPRARGEHDHDADRLGFTTALELREQSDQDAREHGAELLEAPGGHR